ncbi:PepSY domain-containing protein, partial [Massilia arenosa]
GGASLAPSPAAILATLRRAYPERDGPWRIELPLDADQQVLARYPKPVERAGRHFAPLMVTLDPATLRITSSRFWGDTLMTWTFDLHYTLLLDKPGLMLTGVVGLLFALVMASGIYLWWPSKARFWTALRIVPRPGAVRRAYDMHCSSGVYWLALLLILSITGAALALPDQAKALVRAQALPTVSLARAPVVAAAAQRLPAAALPTAPITLDDAVAAGQRRFPTAEVRWIETSGAAHTPIILRMHQPSEPSRRFPQTRVWLDPDSGAPLAAHDALAASSGTQATYWLHPLHNGEVFGLWGRLAVFASGFIPLLLLITGLIRWRHKVRARAIAQTSRPPRGRTPLPERGRTPD